MANFIITPSSLHPIDVTAAIFALSDVPEAHLDVLIETGPMMSASNIRSRFGAAHRALPLPFAVFEHEGTVRQIHIPMNLENQVSGAMTFVDACSLLPGGEYFDSTRLSKLCQKRDSVQSVHMQVFKIVLGDLVSPESLRIEDFESAKLSVRGTEVTRKAIARFSDDLRNSGNGEYFFDKGGSIDLNGADGHFRCKKVAVEDAAVFLIHEHKDTTTKINIEDVVANPLFDLNFVGPMQIYWMSNWGEVVHLPWYCQLKKDSALSEGVNDGITERISPFSVSSKERCPSNGKSAKRLSPSGYSLLDYLGVSKVKSFVVACICRYQLDEEIETSLWSTITNYYPSTKQKALKSQSAASSIRDKLLSEKTELFKKHGLLNLSCFEKAGDAFIADRLVSAWVLSNCVREKLSMRSANFDPMNSFDSISKKLKLNDDEVLSVHNVSIFVKNIYQDAEKWCQWMAPNVDHFNPNSFEPQDISHALQKLIESRSDVVTTWNSDWNHSPLRLCRALEHQLTLVLKVMIAYLGGPLKAHILNLWLLDGSPQLIDCKSALYSNRKQNNLSLEAAFWTKI